VDQRILEVKRAHERKLLGKKNVVGVGVGKKIVGGKQTDQYCITVMVTEKVPIQALSTKDVIAREIEGVVTDVVQVGTIRALAQRRTAGDRRRQ